MIARRDPSQSRAAAGAPGAGGVCRRAVRGRQLGGRSSDDAVDSARPDATRHRDGQADEKSDKTKATAKTYTVQAGDTPSGIAERTGALGELLDANPNADPNTLSPGQKLKLP